MKMRREGPEEKPKETLGTGEGEVEIGTTITENNQENEEASEDHYSVGGDNGL